MKASASLLAAACALLLSACGSGDSASYLIDGTGSLALTLVRDKSFVWDDTWDLALVVTRDPECQRRHALKPANVSGNFKLEVYRTPEGAFILRQGKRWYVTETEKCQLQQFKEPPPAPGELVGSFVNRGEPLHFAPVKAESDAEPAKDAAAPGEAAR